jgi:hypothetical protein
MLEGHDVARLRCEFAADLATPCIVCKHLTGPTRPLDWRNVLPGLVVARAVSMMQRVEDPKLSLPPRIQDLQHVWDTRGNALQAIPYFASLGNEIVVRIDDEDSAVISLSYFTSVTMYFQPRRQASGLSLFPRLLFGKPHFIADCIRL